MNEMKKILNLWLMAALMCGLGLSVTSCKDDDDDSKSEEQQQQEQEQQASKFWSVVGQLVSSDDYTADYADKTFEPTYGTADATNETTRIVETNDMQTAARRFSDLVGASIDENTPSYTYSDPEVGTLTYTRGGTADDWATVDVNIKQVPRLRKIIYREGGEGTNASFAGKAWYRFGDVVSRTLDNGKVEYWICVRPAFGPEKKGDSHWVCLNYLPPKNFFNYSYDSKSWTVPTGIGTDKENMQNLAEMLYAITRPEQWYNNANNYHTDGKLWGFSGLPIFADFKKANVMYHNQYFWQKVADGWTKHGVDDKAMNVQLGDLADRIDREGIHLLYEGYSWWTKTSWNCKLWQASYTNGTKNDEKNLHHAEYKDITKRMQDIKFDCTKMGSSTDNYIQFFDNDGKYRWVIRHATGKELNGGSQPAPTSEFQGANIKTVYRYYEEYPAEWEKKGPNDDNGPEVAVAPVQSLQEAKIGAILGSDAKFYNNVTDAKNATGKDAVGIVVCLNGSKRVEKGQDWNGLIILLKMTERLAFGMPNEDCDDEVKFFNGLYDSMGYIEKDVNGQKVRYYVADELNGLYYTEYYSNGCNGRGHDHPIVKACNYDVFPNNANFSKAFMPSAGQFILAMKGLGIEWNREWGFNNPDWPQRDAAKDAQQVEHAKTILQESGCDITVNAACLTTTQSHREAQALFKFNYETLTHGLLNTPKATSFPTRPFIAFKYNGGATQD